MTEEVVRPDIIAKRPADFPESNSNIIRILQDTYRPLPGPQSPAEQTAPGAPGAFDAENPGPATVPPEYSPRMPEARIAEPRENVRDSMVRASDSLSAQLKSYEQALDKAQAEQGFLGNILDSVKNNLGGSAKDGSWWSYVINSDDGSAQVTKDLQTLRYQITQANASALTGDVEQFSKKYEQLTGHKYSATDVAVLNAHGASDSIDNFVNCQNSDVETISTIASIAGIAVASRGNGSAGATLLKAALVGGAVKSTLTLGQGDTSFLRQFGRGAVLGGSLVAGELAAGRVSTQVALNKSLLLEGEGRFARIVTGGLDYSKQGLKTRLISAAAYHGTMGSVVCAGGIVGSEAVASIAEQRLPNVSRTMRSAIAAGVVGFGVGTGLGVLCGAVVERPTITAEVAPRLETPNVVTKVADELTPEAVVSEVAAPAGPKAVPPNLMKDPAFIDRELRRADLFGKKDHSIANLLKDEAEFPGRFADIPNKHLRQEVGELITDKSPADILKLSEERLARAQRWQVYIDRLNEAKAKLA